MDLLLYGEISNVVWAKLYAASLVKDLRFIEGMVHEDTLFTFEAISKTERCAVCEEIIYHYYQREGSITHTYSETNIKDIIKSREMVLSFLRRKGKYSDDDVRILYYRIQYWWYLQITIQNQYKAYSNGFLESMKNFQKEQRRQLLSSIRRKKRNDHLRFKGVVKMWIIKYCPFAGCSFSDFIRKRMIL